MVIPFRRTIWSSSMVGGTVGLDRNFITIWSGRRSGVGGFRIVYWSMDDAYNGVVQRTAGAQASHNADDWIDVTLSPAPAVAFGYGVGHGGARFSLTEEAHLPYLRIGLYVERNGTPTGSALQTIEGRLTLIGESV